MSKKHLLIIGATAGITVAAGATAAGVLLSKQSSNNDAISLNNEAETSSVTISELIKKVSDHKWDRSKSAYDLFPNGVGTELSANQIQDLGLSTSYAGLKLVISVDEISSSELTLGISLVKNPTTQYTQTVKLVGFTSAEDSILIANAKSALEGKNLTIRNRNLVAEEFQFSYDNSGSTKGKITYLTTANNTLRSHLEILAKLGTGVTADIDGNKLNVVITLNDASQIEFLLDGFVSGVEAFNKLARQLSGDYDVKQAANTTKFSIESDNFTIGDLVDDLDKKLKDANVELEDLLPIGLRETDDAVVFDAIVKSKKANLETSMFIAVKGLTADKVYDATEWDNILDQDVKNISNQTYKVDFKINNKNQPLTVSQLIEAATPKTLWVYLENKFKTDLDKANLEKISITADNTDSNVANVKATIVVGTFNREVSFKVNGLVADDKENATSNLNNAYLLLNRNVFSVGKQINVDEFVKTVKPENLVSLLNKNFSDSLSGAQIKNIEAVVSATNPSEATLKVKLGFNGISETKEVTFDVNNLLAIPSDAELISALSVALNGDYESVDKSLSTLEFAKKVKADNLISLVKNIDSKLEKLEIKSITFSNIEDDATSVLLNVQVSLIGSNTVALSQIKVANLLSSQAVVKSANQDKLASVIKNISNQTFPVATSLTSVSTFLENTNSVSLEGLLQNDFSLALDGAKIDLIKASTDASNATQALIHATIAVGDEKQEVNFKVNKLVADAEVEANKKLDILLSLLNGKSFGAINKEEAQFLNSKINSKNVFDLVDAKLEKELTGFSIIKFSSSINKNNLSQVELNLELSHANTNKTVSLKLFINNLLSAPASDFAQEKLDEIVNNLNGKLFNVKVETINTTFANSVNKNNLKLQLVNSFINLLDVSNLENVNVLTKQISDQDEIELELTISRQDANTRTTKIRVGNLISQDQADKLSLQAKARQLQNALNNQTFAVNPTDSKLHTKAYLDKLTAGFLNTIPTELKDQFDSNLVTLSTVNYTPVIGTSVLANLNIQAYPGAPILSANVTLNNLYPFGVINGTEYLNKALKDSTEKVVSSWISNPKTSNLTADQFAEKVLKNGSPLQKLNNLAAELNLNDSQKTALTNLVLELPSLTSLNETSFDLVIEYNNNQGELFLITKADATGPIFTNGSETDIRYYANQKVSLSKLISFKAGHYSELQELLAVNNNISIQIPNRRMASEWISYYRDYAPTADKNFGPKTLLNWLADDTNSTYLREINALIKSATNVNYTWKSNYEFSITLKVVDTNNQTSHLTINLFSNAPAMETVKTLVSVYENYPLTEMFNVYNYEAARGAIADFIKVHGGVRASLANEVLNFKNLLKISYAPLSATSRDTVVFNFLSTTNQTYSIAIQFDDLRLTTIDNYIEAAINAQQIEYFVSQKWLRTMDRIWAHGETPTQWLTWNQQNLLIKVLHYRSDRHINVGDYFYKKNGVHNFDLIGQKASIRPINADEAVARMSFAMTDKSGLKVRLFDKDHVLRHWEAHYMGTINWLNPNW